MLEDAFGNPLSTSSATARDAYVDGVWRSLGAEAGNEARLQDAIAADPVWPLPRIALVRSLQIRGDVAAAREALSAIDADAVGLNEWEASHLQVLTLLARGKAGPGFAAIQRHLARWPRDPLVLSPCCGVFGLIAFSGRSGAPAEVLSFVRQYQRDWGDDWWYASMLAFAEVEAAQLDAAEPHIRASLDARPGSAHGAHVLAHLLYERGDAAAGLAALEQFMADYPREGLLHCHISWHIALWSLAGGDSERAFVLLDEDVLGAGDAAPPINVVTDACSLLLRAQLADIDVRSEQWCRVSDLFVDHFPQPGLAFLDLHAAAAHAMAGRHERLSALRDGARGPLADWVAVVADGFARLAERQWLSAAEVLAPVMAEHARFGGSNAQRDLLEMAYAAALRRAGYADEARRALVSRRPAQMAWLMPGTAA